jgi:hypothetical protein
MPGMTGSFQKPVNPHKTHKLRIFSKNISIFENFLNFIKASILQNIIYISLSVVTNTMRTEIERQNGYDEKSC